MPEQTDKHTDEREVEREVGVERPDGTTVEVETDREASHEHATRKTTDDDEAEPAKP